MRNFREFISARAIVPCIVLGLASSLLTGCGAGIIASPSGSPVATIPGISGNVMGGETPVVNSVVTLWETDPTNSGYGATARAIETATWSGQIFTFATGYTCTNNNDFLYATATGGDVSGGLSAPIINPNLILIAPVGPCSSFATPSQQSAYFMVLNEVTTVAMAYALGNFTTVVPNGDVGTQSVYIGAPATNNATTGSCTGTGTSMSCTAAGLSHAFANAMNLVNSVGSVYATVPNNSLGSVPQAVINTLGNIMQFCTNSTGGVAGDSSNCGIFFTDATPTAGTAPTDTLTALINVAHFPTHNVGSSCTGSTGGLFCLATAQTAFSPALSAVPHDWSIAIAYTGDSQGSFGYPQYLGLDANDNVYLETSNANSGTQFGQAAMTSAGDSIWYHATSTSQCGPGSIAPDTNGNVFFSYYASSTSTCTWGIYGYSAASGTQTYQFGPGSGTVCGTASPTSVNCPGFPAGGYDTVHPIQSTPSGIAVDRFNNLWYNRRSTTCIQCMLELPYSGSNYGAFTTFEGTSGANWDAAYQLLIDAGGNVYSSSLIASIFVTPNTGTAAAPTYTNGTGYITVALASADFGGVSVDSAGNVWAGIASNFAEFAPVTTSGVITSFGAATNFAYAATAPHSGGIDGHDRLYAANYSISGNIYAQVSPAAPGYNASAQNAFVFNPCYVPASASTCSTTIPTSDPNVIQVDSTGSIWIAGKGSSSGAQAFVVQVIGTGYPTWPQYSYGKFGVTP